jgi:hypothetical protein
VVPVSGADRTCAWVREAAPEFVLGTLDGFERVDLVDHISQCARCREDISALSTSINDLAVLAEPMAPSPGFEERVLAAISAISVTAASRPAEHLAVDSAAATVGAPETTATSPDQGASVGPIITTPAMVASSRRRRRIVALVGALVVALVAAGVIRIVADRGHDRGPQQFAVAMVAENGQKIGQSMVVRGAPDTVVITVSYPFPGTDYLLQGVAKGGEVVQIGRMHLVDAVWRWRGALPAGKDLQQLRIITPTGLVVCHGQFPV